MHPRESLSLTLRTRIVQIHVAIWHLPQLLPMTCGIPLVPHHLAIPPALRLTAPSPVDGPTHALRLDQVPNRQHRWSLRRFQSEARTESLPELKPLFNRIQHRQRTPTIGRTRWPIAFQIQAIHLAKIRLSDPKRIACPIRPAANQLVEVLDPNRSRRVPHQTAVALPVQLQPPCP